MANTAAEAAAKGQYEEEAKWANEEIRWIQQRIGDEKNALNQAQISLDYELAYDAGVKS